MPTKKDADQDRKDKEEIIRKAYYDVSTGFTGVEKLYRLLRNKGITRKNIKDFLAKQEIVQISKKNYGKLNSFIPQYPLQEFQIDLIYLENKHLNKASYGLVAIDAFTKKATVELMKKKTSGEVITAMKKVFNKLGIPEMIYADEGSEFTNNEFKRFLNEHGVELVLTLRHATMAERFNRTFKELLYKYLQSTNTKTIVKVLPKILHNYNNSYHKTIGMAPNEVNEDNQKEVLANIRKVSIRRLREEIKPGDKVRVQLKQKSFTKGYKPKYSKEIYTVESKQGKYWKVTGLDRLYLRAFLEKVGEVERNENIPDLEGTREGHLKELAKRERQVITLPTSIPAPRPKRMRKTPVRFSP